MPAQPGGRGGPTGPDPAAPALATPPKRYEALFAPVSPRWRPTEEIEADLVLAGRADTAALSRRVGARVELLVRCIDEAFGDAAASGQPSGCHRRIH